MCRRAVAVRGGLRKQLEQRSGVVGDSEHAARERADRAAGERAELAARWRARAESAVATAEHQPQPDPTTSGQRHDPASAPESERQSAAALIGNGRPALPPRPHAMRERRLDQDRGQRQRA